jgi:hypothetical protein
MNRILDGMRSLLVVVGVILGLMPATAAGQIKAEELNKLLRWKGEITIDSQQKVVLVGGEKALLLSVTAMDQFSRADGETQLVLFRTALGEARKVGADARVRVMDLDHKGASELELHYSFMAQGYEEGRRVVAVLDGWQVKPLLVSQNSSDNGAAVDPDSPEYHAVEVEFVYADLNDDGIDDVIEKLTETKGSRVVRRSTRRYWYKNGRLVAK